MLSKITIETVAGIKVLRDDLLPGGTKSIVLPVIVSNQFKEYVYASPVYGGFQIALTKYCASVGKQATIFCANRNERHPNTQEIINCGGRVIEVKNGYLSVVEKAARLYVFSNKNRFKINFGAHEPGVRELLIAYVRRVMRKLKHEPDEIWCAIGSGLLFECLIEATSTAQINGVVVGRSYATAPSGERRYKIYQYPKPFDYVCDYPTPFPSMPNYDRKAYQYCQQYRKNHHNTLFWNVL